MSKKLSIFTFSGLILGVLSGLTIPNIMINIGFLGDIYVNLLKALIIPILFCSIVSALCSTNTNKSSKITILAIILFIIMFLISFSINSLFVFYTNPGHSFSFIPVEWTGTITNINLKDFFISIFPSNIFSAAAGNQILPIIIFAFAFGWILNKSKYECNIEMFEYVFNQMLQLVIYFTPIAVFSLIGNTVANYGINILKSAIAYIGTAWIGSIIIVLLVMIVPVTIFCKINPIEYFKKISKIWLVTLSTCSSAATLPTTIKLCNEELNIPKDITNITVPLGCTIHMCGGAVSFSLLAIFSCQMYGIHITPFMWILMAVVALIINMGAPGIPGGGIVIGATYLSILGIPLNFIGFYAGIYKLLDMAYTTLNVTGDITANCLINKVINK